MKRFLKLLLAAALALAPVSVPIHVAHAAASSQLTHAFLCAQEPASAASGPRRVVNPVTNAAYVLNNAGCALINGADIGYMLSQGFTYGPAVLSMQATAITSSSTTAVSTTLTLPAYGYIVGIVLCETAGNAVTGGLNVGDAGSATRYGSAVALGANACVSVPDSGNARLFVSSGVPTASTILLAAATSWNSASVNITVLYSYF